MTIAAAATEAAIAFDGTNVVIAWDDGTTLFAQHFATSLDPIDPIPIPIAQTSPLQISMAAGGGAALLAWTAGSPFAWVDAAMIPAAGTPAAIKIVRNEPVARNAAVAWNGSEFLLLWAAVTESGIRVRADGTAVDAVPLKIWETELAPILASNGNDFFAAWTTYDQATGVHLIGMHIAPDGTPGSAQELLHGSENLQPIAAALRGAYVAGAMTQTFFAPFTNTLEWTFAGSGMIDSLPFPMLYDDPYLPMGAALAGSGNRLLAAYTRIDPDAGWVRRVFVRVIEAQRPHAARH